MSRQSISLTDPNAEWLNKKVNIEHEYRSNSEAVNDLIRKAREIEAIRAKLIEAEQSRLYTNEPRRDTRRNKGRVAAQWRATGSVKRRGEI